MRRHYRTGILILLLMSAALFAGQSQALAQKKLGAGIVIGEPTGISIRYGNFPVVGIAWSLNNHLHLHCDYWFYRDTLKKPLYWYGGLGFKFRYFTGDTNEKGRDDEKTGFGMRIPLGVQYYVIKDLELFCEIVPGISLYPSTEVDFDAGIGIRYFFW